MKRYEELIRENVLGLGGHHDHLSASLAHMLYCIVAKDQYNLTYFFVRQIECARATPNANLPYGMFLTPRHSVSSSSEHHYGSLSHHGDNDEDDDASRACTLSPTTYLNSLRLLNYQRYDISTSS
ncbi:hypothetical protein Tco_0187454 [Tanacetum coccineum]